MKRLEKIKRIAYIGGFIIMSTINSSTDSQNNNREFSSFCHEHSKPTTELFSLLNEGLEAEKAGQIRSFKEAIFDIREKI